MKKNYLAILITLLFLIFLPKSAIAADMNVSCPEEPTSCTVSGLNPLFTPSDIWVPGKTITKTFNLKNSSPQNRVMAIKATKTIDDPILESVLQITIQEVGGAVFWSGTLGQFYLVDHIELGNFAANGGNKDFNFIVSMDSSADNTYKNKKSTFDLKLGFYGLPISSGGGGGLSGGGDGGGGGAPVCNDQYPQSAPKLLSVIQYGPNKVKLTWSQAQSPVTYYLVAFGTSPGIPLYGNPNVGGVNTTTYTVEGLSGGTTYYFRVRAGNGCAPGPFSNELSVSPSGPVIQGGLQAALPKGFEAGVLGAITDDATNSANPEVISLEGSNPGFMDKSTRDRLLRLSRDYWWVLLLLLLLIWFMLWRRKRKNN